MSESRLGGRFSRAVGAWLLLFAGCTGVPSEDPEAPPTSEPYRLEAEEVLHRPVAAPSPSHEAAAPDRRVVFTCWGSDPLLEAIAASLAEHDIEEIDACFALAPGGAAPGGEVEVAARMGGTGLGDVRLVRETLGDEAAARCVVERVQGWWPGRWPMEPGSMGWTFRAR